MSLLSSIDSLVSILFQFSFQWYATWFAQLVFFHMFIIVLPLQVRGGLVDLCEDCLSCIVVRVCVFAVFQI